VVLGTIGGPLAAVWALGASPLVVLAWPARYAWAWFFCRPLLQERWVPARAVALSVLAVAGTISMLTFADLAGLLAAHPGWFVLLELWQAPTYVWLNLLPRWYFWDRPDYLWIASSWTFLESAIIFVVLWRWNPDGSQAD
jgi:hypothetical protein